MEETFHQYETLTRNLLDFEKNMRAPAIIFNFKKLKIVQYDLFRFLVYLET